MSGPDASRPGSMLVTTVSGATYEFAGRRMRRLAGDSSTDLRRDGAWINLFELPHPRVGEPMRLFLAPLRSDATMTCRITTPVVAIDGRREDADD